MTSGSPNNYRFKFWLSLFALLLLSIPFFIWLDFFLLAKLTGILVLILLLFAMRKWFAQARSNNNRVERVVLSTNDLFLLKQILPAYYTFDSSDQRILNDQLGLFLAEVRFKGEWSLKSQMIAGIMVVLATWQNGYTNKQSWTIILDEDQSVYLEDFPQITFAISEDSLKGASLAALLQHETIASLRAELQILP